MSNTIHIATILVVLTASCSANEQQTDPMSLLNAPLQVTEVSENAATKYGVESYEVTRPNSTSLSIIAKRQGGDHRILVSSRPNRQFSVLFSDDQKSEESICTIPKLEDSTLDCSQYATDQTVNDQINTYVLDVKRSINKKAGASDKQQIQSLFECFVGNAPLCALCHILATTGVAL